MRAPDYTEQGNMVHDDARLAALALIFCPIVEAADWQSANLQMLYGSDYKLGAAERTLITLEYANSWRYGDNFFFIDITDPMGDGASHYAEFSPRLSLGKTLGLKPPTGFIKDTYIAATLETGEGVNAQLVGVGAAFNLPGFRYSNFNLYHRRSHRDSAAHQTDGGGQLTITWLYPFSLGAMHWSFGGFLDYAWGENGGSRPKADNLMCAPQLLLDLGRFWGQPNSLYVGIEHQVWRNKFGVAGVDEDVSQAMVKWNF